MIQIEDVSFTYKEAKVPALCHVSLSIADGDFVGIIGSSGAGKTTLSYVLNGIIPHYYQGDYYGRVLVDNVDVFESDPSTLALDIGSVLQDITNQTISQTVEDEILFGLENFGIPKQSREDRLSKALAQTGITHLRSRCIDELSGGQKQKVAIAAIIALRPRILLLDEPTGELDPYSSRSVFDLLKELNETLGMTIIVIEQKIMLLCEYAKRLVVMNNGRIASCGDVRTVLSDTSVLNESGINCPRVVTLYNKLCERNIISQNTPLCVTVPEAATIVRDFLNQNKAHDLLQDLRSDMRLIPQHTSEPVIISAEHLSFGYEQPLLNDVSFSIHAGEFLAITGKNGAGKTTLIKLIAGLLRPSSGRLCINGLDTSITKHSVLAKKIGFLFQDPDRLLSKSNVYDEIMTGLRCTGFSTQDAEQRTLEICHEFGFATDSIPFMLSRGERQRLALACIVAVRPHVLILDEPTTGLDYRECMHVMEIVRKLNAQGTTVIMVCHDMEMVLDFAERMIVVSDGKILSDGSVYDVFSNKDILDRASLLPPQIKQLADIFEQQSIFTVTEMCNTLQSYSLTVPEIQEVLS